MLKLLVGLGNPGRQYAKTRHNVGFWVVERFVSHFGERFLSDPRFKVEWARVSLPSHTSLWVIKPTTFVNESGVAVRAFSNFYRIATEEIMLAFDDLDLPPGSARLRKSGGDGGHRGVRSVIQMMNGNNFLRLRIGIGRPTERSKVVSYVLASPNKSDTEAIHSAIDHSLDSLPLVVGNQYASAMNLINKKHTNSTAQDS